jgi:hypothetical protein
VELARVVALVVAAAWLAWNLYRHVAVYAGRGRVIAVTPPVLARILALAGLGAALAAPSPSLWSVAAVAAAAAVALRLAQVWVTLGTSVERVLERAALVLGGMGLASEVTERALHGAGGRLRITVIASLGGRMHLLRVRSRRGIKKLDLFRANLRKFLLAMSRGEGR